MRPITRDVVIREAVRADAAAIARVYVDTWRAAYRDILPAAYLDKLSVDAQTRSWRRMIGGRDDIVLVAVASGDVVGFSSGGREREQDPFFRGEISTLYVHPDMQRRNIGASLLLSMWRCLVGLSPVIVWVLEDNQGAQRFYEAMGGVLVRTKPETIGEKTLQKIAYAFFDVG